MGTDGTPSGNNCCLLAQRCKSGEFAFGEPSVPSRNLWWVAGHRLASADFCLFSACSACYFTLFLCIVFTVHAVRRSSGLFTDLNQNMHGAKKLQAASIDFHASVSNACCQVAGQTGYRATPCPTSGPWVPETIAVLWLWPL